MQNKTLWVRFAVRLGDCRNAGIDATRPRLFSTPSAPVRIVRSGAARSQRRLGQNRVDVSSDEPR